MALDALSQKPRRRRDPFSPVQTIDQARHARPLPLAGHSLSDRHHSSSRSSRISDSHVHRKPNMVRRADVGTTLWRNFRTGPAQL